MPRTDFLDRQRKQITARLNELRPLYEEYLTLEKAQEALEQVGGPVRRAVGNGRRRVVRTGRGPGRPKTRRGPGRPPARRGPGRPPGRRSTGRPAARRQGRKRAGGTRADQALTAIKKNPGITIPELAKRLRIRPNYLYRVTGGLEKENRVRRRNGGFHAA
jgi:hypothetical protein